jgi:thiol-disulfide isomerase/thioredoxin
MRINPTFLGCGLLVLVTGAAAAGLEIGDQAPPLKISEWVKGQSVDLEEVRGSKVVVLEFWATWCAPCIAHVPHLTELQTKHAKDVVVIGLTSEDPANSLDTVRKFVATQGKKMGYTVAFDEGIVTQRAYMEATGVEHLPTAYVIDKRGRLAWAGSPDEQLDLAVERTVAGTIDFERVKRRFHAERTIESAMDKEEWSAALEAIDAFLEVAELSPEARVPFDWQRFWCLARDTAATSQARQVGQAVVPRDELAERLDGYAWQMMDDPTFGGRFTALALAAAKRANELTNGRNPSILDTLARAHFEAGQVDQAVELAKQAVDQAEGPAKEFFKHSLAKYQEASQGNG